MKRFALALMMLVSPLSPAHAKDDGSGKYDYIPPTVRAWAKSMVSWQGVPCCEIADGTRTVFDIREGQYWIPIKEKGGAYFPVPPEAVITNRGNPVASWCNDDPEACKDTPGDAMAWYVLTGPNDTVYVRCFVPGSGI